MTNWKKSFTMNLMKVLIADDSAFMRSILKDIVGQSSWKDATVIEADDGVKAVEKYNQEKPELVLLDIIMPQKDGIEVLKNIGQLSPTVVIVSSVGQEQVIAQAKQLGAKDYIVKPFDSRKVVEVIDGLLPK